MTIGSLFSGVGGLELGLEQAGLGPVVWQVEKDEYCRRVLALHWPKIDRKVEDVRDAGAATLAPVDIVCGGFPCQDVSVAGRGAGLDGERSGLWREFRRVVDEVNPSIVVVENVASGARRWLCAVRSDLHELGYRTRALGIGASDVGAPHLRRRIFVLAYANSVQLRDEPWRSEGARRSDATELGGSREGEGRSRARRRNPGEPARRSGSTIEDVSQPCVGRDAHGLPAGLDGSHRWPSGRGCEQEEWEPPRLTPDVPDRAKRLRALGNAVVPQCAQIVGRIILEDAPRLFERVAGERG